MKKIAVLAIALGFTCVPSFAQYDDEDYGETPAATEDDSYSTEESTQAEPAEEAESAAPAAEKSSDDTDYKKIRLGGHIGVGVGGLGDLTAVGGYATLLPLAAMWAVPSVTISTSSLLSHPK